MYSTRIYRWTCGVVVWGLMALAAAGCSKSRADDFSRFKSAASLQSAGVAPHVQLRYRPVAREDVVFSLLVNRQCPSLGLKAKMRLRVAFKVDTLSGGGGSFVLRLIALQRLDPPPAGGLPELGPAYVLLQGRMGPRGRLTEIQDSDKLPSPVNLALALPLLLPQLPDRAVGVGAKWRASGKQRWKRGQSADSLTNQPGFKGSTEVLLHSAYELTRRQGGSQPVIRGKLRFKLRSHTRTLSHVTHHRGEGTATARYVVNPADGLPVRAVVDLQGTYKLRANDRTISVKETIKLTFKRE